MSVLYILPLGELLNTDAPCACLWVGSRRCSGGDCPSHSIRIWSIASRKSWVSASWLHGNTSCWFLLNSSKIITSCKQIEILTLREHKEWCCLFKCLNRTEVLQLRLVLSRIVATPLSSRLTHMIGCSIMSVWIGTMWESLDKKLLGSYITHRENQCLKKMKGVLA